ncbi:MAG: hypothetical protein ACI9FU_001878 [Granulosicoccus sp.]|jgi:hypothetical protein
MKKLLTILLAFSTTASFAQNVRGGGWAEQFMVGASVSANTTWLLNDAVSNQRTGTTDLEFSMGYNVGITGGYHYNDHIAMGLDLQFFTLNQRYTGKDNALFWESKVSLSGVQIPVYAKFMTSSGLFVEAGWQFSFVTSAQYTRGITNGTEEPVDQDQSATYSKVLYSPHLGLGMDWYLNDMWVITTGLRANYSINDLKGVDGQGRNVNTDPIYTDPKPTNALSVGIFIGVRYMIDAGGRY